MKIHLILAALGVLGGALRAQQAVPAQPAAKDVGGQVLTDLLRKLLPDEPAAAGPGEAPAQSAAAANDLLKPPPAAYHSPLGSSGGLSTGRLQGAQLQPSGYQALPQGAPPQAGAAAPALPGAGGIPGQTAAASLPQPLPPIVPPAAAKPGAAAVEPVNVGTSAIPGVAPGASPPSSVPRRVVAKRDYLAETFVQNPQGYPARVGVPLVRGQRYQATVLADRIVVNVDGFLVTVPADALQIEGN